MISVVMLVRDRLELTKQALLSCVKNNRHPFVLTIVDDASETETRNWLEHWEPVTYKSPKSAVQLIRNDVSKGTGWARNQGIEAARKRWGYDQYQDDSWLYLSDNDVWFAPGWDEVLLEAHHKHPSFKIIGGGCHPFLQPKPPAHRFVAGGGLYKLEPRDAVSGYSWLLDWETWDKYGPLDAHALGVRQSEDFAFCRKIVEAGHFVGAVTPEVVLHTGLHDSFGERPPGWELIEQNKKPGVLYE